MRGDWQPTAPIENLKARARILQQIRTFFLERGLLEVDTPALSQAGLTDPNIESFRTTGADVALYLHSSPEFPMKRLLAAGSGSIYQIAKVFRQGESGRHHNPEFTLLEWYRVGWNYRQIMDEIVELLTPILGERCLQAPPEWLSYGDAFALHLALDPLNASIDQLAQCAARQEIALHAGEMSRGAWLDLLFGGIIQPQLGRGKITFIYDYPADQASLARIKPSDPGLAERFELFIDGIELGNGFGELTHADEQRTRFEHELQKRAARGMHLPQIDENLLDALEAGLPECAGVAIGIERLLMVVLRAASIDEVIAFPTGRS